MDRAVRSIISDQKPVTAPPFHTVAKAARTMKEHHVSALLVVDHGRLSGIFTEHDMASRVVAEGRKPEKTRLAEVMTQDPCAITPDRPFSHALHIMFEGHFRHVPVVENGRLLGMVSARDALTPELRDFVADLETREHIGEILG